MAYDEYLADRIRAALASRHGLSEKRMFGGLAFLIHGHMAVAASGQGGLLIRCDPATADDHLTDGVEPMVMRGRPMNSWLRVADERTADDDALEHWLTVATAYTETLPPKP